MTTLALRIRDADWRALQDILFRDGDEHGAAVLCGWHHSTDRDQLVVRQVVPAVDGVDYIPGTRGYRHLTGEFVTRQLRIAKDLNLAYLAVHNHGGRGPVRFSWPDIQSHERAYPTLLKVSGQPVGGLVMTCDAIAGDIWMPDGTRRSLMQLTVVGDRLERITPEGPLTLGSFQGENDVPAVYNRQSLLFGVQGQAILRTLRVGVVGAGGVGTLAIQALARLGVGQFVIIDPDVVAESNLSRLPEARRRDAFGFLGDRRMGRWARRLGFRGPTPKTMLAKRIILGANPDARVDLIEADVAEDPAARELCSCDFIFLAADTMLARDIVNQIAYQYLIPTLQIGSRILLDAASKNVSDIYAAIRSLGTTPGCLRCNGLVNVAQLTEESLATEEQRRNQRYVDDPDVVAPSVITLNAMGVGWAVNDFMQYATGLGRPSAGYRVLRSQPVGRTGQQLTLQMPDVDPECHVCGQLNHSALSRADGIELPTRVRITPTRRSLREAGTSIRRRGR